MSSFEVKVCKLKIEKHPNADLLEIALIGGYKAVVPIGKFKTGDLAVYIPEQSIVPELIIEELGLKGKLSGKKSNRVKAFQIRGIISQGLVYPNKENWKEGECLQDYLNITKYKPKIPDNLLGEISYVGEEYTINYDIENIKKYPDLLKEDDIVEITEKVHGTFFMISSVPISKSNPLLINGRNSISSKGLSKKGFSFLDCKENENNVYLKIVKKYNLFEIANKLSDELNETIIIAGEIFGSSIQDLGYGLINDLDYRIFDVAVGNERYNKVFFSPEKLNEFTSNNNLKKVPILYYGKFNTSVLTTYTNGKETISGKEKHIREGVIVKLISSEKNTNFSRVILKSVSDAYLIRENGTEYN